VVALSSRDNGLVSRRERDVRRDALAETRIERSAPRTRRRGALGTHEPRAWPFRKTRFLVAPVMLELELEIRVVACGLRRVRRLDEADLREFARS
jgi:hypothetical protein